MGIEKTELIENTSRSRRLNRPINGFGGTYWVHGRYWSVEAYASWRRLYFAVPEAKRTARDGGPSLATIPRRASGDDWLIHEHVVPQKVLLDLIIKVREPVGKILDMNIGAVITRREDRGLPGISSHPNPEDPWKRYAGTGITFLANPAWSQRQREALNRHGLINTSGD